MILEEYKNEIKKALVEAYKEVGKEVPNPDEVFAYFSEEDVRELYEQGVSPKDAYFQLTLKAFFSN